MVSNEELYNALITIKKLCAEKKYCQNCPLCDYNCVLKTEDIIPSEWVIESPPPSTYRPIKIE